MPWIFSSFVDLKAWLYDQNQKPNGLTLQAAQKINIQTCKNSQKAKIWNQGSRSIQVPIPFSKACQGCPDQIPIINFLSNAKNWYQELKLCHKNFQIAYHNLRILVHFYSWILVQCEVCKLTITFNWSFVRFWPSYHVCSLGFSEGKIRAFTIKQNWPSRPWRLHSASLDEPEAYLAMNLYML